ncbi:MAG: ATP-binding protein [Moraxellaceae bacterium]|nr:ATP-binding protein [Moraxellaceae bacterium]
MRSVKTVWRNSLRLKILLAYVVGVVVSIAVFAVAAVMILENSTLAARIDLDELAGELVNNIRFDDQGRPTGMDFSDEGTVWISDSLRREMAYRILDASGHAVVMSEAGAAFWLDADRQRPPAPGGFEFLYDGVTIYGATESVQRDGQRWYLQIAISARMMALMHGAALPLVVGGVGVFSVVLLLGFGACAYVTLRYTLKPLSDLSDAAAAISPRSLHARLGADSIPSEIAPLVDSFNRALERLENGYRVQQEFLGNAAHELKTPLALIRAQIELREDDEDRAGDREALLRDVSYMSRQVQQLLLLAEVSEVQNYVIEEVQVDALVQEVLVYLQRMADAAGVHVAVQVSPAQAGLRWQADRGALFTLLKNLLENAIQHAPRGSSVSVEIEPDCLRVRDRGPGVTAAQLPLLFERFWRAAERRDHGAGLGLSICREIALAHEWTLSAEQVEPGLRFNLCRH